MYENICALPASADVFALVTHPKLPIFAVGLSSGHVQTYRLPSLDPAAPSPSTLFSPSSDPPGRPLSAKLRKPSALRRSSTSSTGSTSSEALNSTIDTLWRTRRHKGSCRALTYSPDGTLLMSAGSDGLVKIADSLSGQVRAKLAVPVLPQSSFPGRPVPDAPTAILVLSPQNIVISTDAGYVHVYGPENPKNPTAWKFNPQPTRSLRPHRNEEDPESEEAITSLTALPPNAESTSGYARSWVSTASMTLAALDLRKDKVEVSGFQGDGLLCSLCVPSSGERPASKGNGKMKVNGTAGRGGAAAAATASGGDLVLVGSDSGIVTVWRRGQWEDQHRRIVVHREAQTHGLSGLSDDSSVDCMALIPRATAAEVGLLGEGSGGKIGAVAVVACGLGNGTIRFVRVGLGKGGGGGGGVGSGREIAGEVGHDEQGVDGVTAIAVEAQGRMISAGGATIKVWGKQEIESEDEDDDEGEDEGGGHDAPLKGTSGKRRASLMMEGVSEEEEEDDDDDDADDGGDDDSDDSEENDDDDDDRDEDEDDDEEDEEESPPPPRKKSRLNSSSNSSNNNKKLNPHGHHGVMAFSGMD